MMNTTWNDKPILLLWVNRFKEKLIITIIVIITVIITSIIVIFNLSRPDHGRREKIKLHF